MFPFVLVFVHKMCGNYWRKKRYFTGCLLFFSQEVNAQVCDTDDSGNDK